MKIKHCRSLFAAMLAGGLLVSCITTTTGGFNVETSDEQALQDYIQLATAYFDADDMAGARRNLESAMAIDDRNSDSHMLLAMIFQQEGDIDLADESFRRAIRFDRGNSRARNNYAAMLFGLERYEAAYEQLEVVANDTGYDGRAIAFENLGRSALMLGRTEEAQMAFGRALQLNGNLYVSALELALIAVNARNWNDAFNNWQHYQTIVEFYQIPHTPRALLAGIQIEGHFQNTEKVEELVTILTALYSDTPEFQIFQSLTDAN